MHVGHVLILLANWELAHSTSDDFVMIWDDFEYFAKRLETQGWSLAKSLPRWREDLVWLGLQPDRECWSLDNAEAHAEYAARLGIRRTHQIVGGCVKGLSGMRWLHNPGAEEARWSCYHPYDVLVRAVDDHLCGIGGFYRGEDLLPEAYLYDHIARQCGFRPPYQAYLKTVFREAAGGKESNSDLSTITVRQLREAGYTARQVLSTVQECARRAYDQQRDRVTIPVGVLEPGEVRSLTWRRDFESVANSARGCEWAEDVRAYGERMMEVLQRATGLAGEAVPSRQVAGEAGTARPAGEVRARC